MLYSCSNYKKAIKSRIVTNVSYLLFTKRWFEFSTVLIQPDTPGGQPYYDLQMTSLRQNADYVQFYGLLGSGFVMVIVPFAALFIAFASIHR